jgi:amidase
VKRFEYGRSSRPIDILKHFENIRRMRFEVGKTIDRFDILLTPTMPIVAPQHGGIYCTTNPTMSAVEFAEVDTALYQYLGVFSVTGHPSVSLPMGQDVEGLPIGVQIVGRLGDEATLLRISSDLEEACPWRHLRPSVRAGRGTAYQP